jgi:hypothetical protein
LKVEMKKEKKWQVANGSVEEEFNIEVTENT